MDDGGDVECQPGDRYDDDPRMIVGGRGVSPDFPNSPYPYKTSVSCKDTAQFTYYDVSVRVENER